MQPSRRGFLASVLAAPLALLGKRPAPPGPIDYWYFAPSPPYSEWRTKIDRCGQLRWNNNWSYFCNYNISNYAVFNRVVDAADIRLLACGNNLEAGAL